MVLTDRFAIKFKHNIDKKRHKGTTECILLEKNGSGEFKAVGKGKSVVGEHDQYNKAIGRKVTITRALKVAKVDKKGRKEFWNAYLENMH